MATKSFGQFDQGAGQRYAEGSKRKGSGGDGRRTPRRDKQTARGKGGEHFAGHAQRMVESARKAMKRGRHRASGE